MWGKGGRSSSSKSALSWCLLEVGYHTTKSKMQRVWGHLYTVPQTSWGALSGLFPFTLSHFDQTHTKRITHPISVTNLGVSCFFFSRLYIYIKQLYSQPCNVCSYGYTPHVCAFVHAGLDHTGALWAYDSYSKWGLSSIEWDLIICILQFSDHKNPIYCQTAHTSLPLVLVSTPGWNTSMSFLCLVYASFVAAETDCKV